jgi:Ni/Fe-hydrogenase subunit HybB-like protein
MALIVGYAYIVEPFVAWYGGNVFERQTFLFRAIGYYSPLFWVMCFCNTIAPIFFFIRKVRTTPICLFVIAILINIGMWLERFVIIVGSMARDYIPYAWGSYWPNWVDWSITFSSFCLFLLLFLLFVRFLPPIAMTEVKAEVKPPIRREGGHYAA